MTGVSRSDIETIRNSDLFDAAWYLEQYPDVKILGMDPAEHYLWLGAKLGRNPSPKFDGRGYLDLNGDVAEAGVNPLVHYVRWGKEEGRERHSVTKDSVNQRLNLMISSPFSNETLKVVWVINPHDKMTQKYRVHNMIEALVLSGRVESVLRQDADLEDNDLAHAHIVILNRITANASILAIIDRFRARGGTVIYDIDDLIFVPEAMEFIRALNNKTPQQHVQFKGMMEGQRKTLWYCDLAVTSTFALKREVERLGKPGVVIPNNIGLSLAERADSLIQQARQGKTLHKRIGYFSGTGTHEIDFAECADVLFALMSERQDIQLMVVGHLDASERFKSFGSRFIKLGLVSHDEMMKYMSTVDINLAPLEIDNLFVHCKSELKIFEAALLEIPTIASPTASYAACIVNGRNGLLARGKEQWRNALLDLLDNPQKRMAMGREARQTIAARFLVSNTAREMLALFEALRGGRQRTVLPRSQKIVAVGGKPVISVISILYRKQDEVVWFMETMRRQSFDLPYEIILVDDVSPDNSVAAVEGFMRDRAHLPDSNPFMSVRILRNDRNVGNCSCRNKGVREARGDIIFVVDADCLFNRDWLAAHYRAHIRGSCDVVIGPKGIETNGAPPFAVLGRHEADPSLAVLEARPQDGMNQDSFINCVTRNLSIRRDYIERDLDGQLFDESFNYSADSESGFGWEDIELGCRLYHAGARIKFLADTVSIHISHPPSAGADKPYRSLKNFRRLHEKHPQLRTLARQWTKQTYAAISNWCRKVGGDLDNNEDYRYLEKHLTSAKSAPVIVTQPQKKMRVLTYRWHCPHQYELYRLGHEFTLVTGLGTRLCESWDWRSRPLPMNATIRHYNTIDPRDFDLAILHFDENILHPDICAGKLTDDWGKTFLYALKAWDLPKVAICHGTPQFYGQFNPNYDSPDLGQVIETNRREIVDLLGDTLVICNSHQARKEWQFKKSRTIWHGFSPHDFPAGKGGDGVFAMGSKALANRPHYNGLFVMGDIQKRLGESIPIHHLNVQDPPHTYMSNTPEWAKAIFENYARALGAFDVYVNPTIRSPMPRTRGEAMMTGVVSVSLRNHDVEMFIENGVNGFYADMPEEMADQITYLLKNQSALTRASAKSRERACDVFNQDRYLSAWSEVIRDLTA